MKLLEGKNAIVTGGSRGIGRGIAKVFAAHGANVAFTYNSSEEAAKELEQELSESGVKAKGYKSNAADFEQAQELIKNVAEDFGAIDILVNNAGGDIGVQGVTGEKAGKPVANDAINVSLEDIRTVLDRNLMTCILPCREIAPEMIDRKQGWIVNIGSIAGLSGHAREVVYGVSKAAVHEYTRCLAAQLRPDNVYVNAIAPGEIITARFVASRPTNEDRKVHDGALTRYGWPDEIAKTVEFFVTNDSSYITGQILRVDGGAQLFPS